MVRKSRKEGVLSGLYTLVRTLRCPQRRGLAGSAMAIWRTRMHHLAGVGHSVNLAYHCVLGLPLVFLYWREPRLSAPIGRDSRSSCFSSIFSLCTCNSLPTVCCTFRCICCSEWVRSVGCSPRSRSSRLCDSIFSSSWLRSSKSFIS